VIALTDEKIDREKMVKETLAALVALEMCSDGEIDGVRMFLNRLSDNQLLDIWIKNKEALKKKATGLQNTRTLDTMP
jgi:hypothetical protein